MAIIFGNTRNARFLSAYWKLCYAILKLELCVSSIELLCRETAGAGSITKTLRRGRQIIYIKSMYKVAAVSWPITLS